MVDVIMSEWMVQKASQRRWLSELKIRKEFGMLKWGGGVIPGGGNSLSKESKERELTYLVLCQ